MLRAGPREPRGAGARLLRAAALSALSPIACFAFAPQPLPRLSALRGPAPAIGGHSTLQKPAFLGSPVAGLGLFSLKKLPTNPKASRKADLIRLLCLSSPNMAPNIQIVLGTMTFGWSYSSKSVDNIVAGEMLDTFFAAGHSEVDTALTYSGGNTEKMIGEIMAPGSDRAGKCGILATKAGPWQGSTMNGNGGQAAVELRSKVEMSLASLKRDSIGLLYLHAPDSGTPIEETLAEVDKLHKEGKIKALGLSNFQAWEVSHIWHTCQANGFLKPTVYQGMYNSITREVERELFPCLRKLGIAFYAYNPLAGGILTGKHSKDAGPSDGRFKDNKMYTDRFWKDSYFDAAQSIKGACDESQVSMLAAALKWMRFHSKLQDGDAIIIGASSMDQLKGNLDVLSESTPLPDSVTSAIDKAWDACGRDCPSYERGHSKIAKLN